MLIPMADVPRWYAERMPQDTIAVVHGTDTLTWEQLETGASQSVVSLIRQDELAIDEVVSALGVIVDAKEIGGKAPNFENFFKAGYYASTAVGIEARASLSSGS